MTTIFRLIETAPDDKSVVLLQRVEEANASSPESGPALGAIFERSAEGFSKIPGSPFAYWANEAIQSVFTEIPKLDNGYLATRGAYTTDDFRFYRLSWEVDLWRISRTRRETRSGSPYVELAKGGAFAEFYSDVHLVIRWENDGSEAKAFLSAYRERKGWGADWSACLNGYSHYFRAGLTWSRRTQKGLSIRALPAGCIFADKGPAIFTRNGNLEELLPLLAIMNSSIFRYLVELQMAFGSYEVGVIQRTPVPAVMGEYGEKFVTLARQAFRIRWGLDSAEETSHAFLLPYLVLQQMRGFNPISPSQELEKIRGQINNLTFELYRIGVDDRAEIESSIAKSATQPPLDFGDEGVDCELDSKTGSDMVSENSVAGLISWLVGVAFGRFDVRLATGDRPVPPEPEPFDPLPARSPGMWPADEKRAEVPPDILVDDAGHGRDLSSLVLTGAELVGVDVSEDLWRWLAREFFPLHIKMYSKSRRKAPIYWQLATPSASYSVWLYIHTFTRDTMFRVQNDYVGPKLRHEERRLAGMEQEAGERSTAAQRREIGRQRDFVAELSAFRDEVRLVAPLWGPDLDDGVIINFAPLWRLVPQHRPWQNELKKTWDELCAGKYDWAHLAMRLWPERVVPKCAADRSLAIAHGLEDVFWEETRNDGWQARLSPRRPLDELIAERTSDAVKAALRGLLDAPVTSSGRGGRRRAAAGTTGQEMR